MTLIEPNDRQHPQDPAEGPDTVTPPDTEHGDRTDGDHQHADEDLDDEELDDEPEGA